MLLLPEELAGAAAGLEGGSATGALATGVAAGGLGGEIVGISSSGASGAFVIALTVSGTSISEPWVEVATWLLSTLMAGGATYAASGGGAGFSSTTSASALTAGAGWAASLKLDFTLVPVSADGSGTERAMGSGVATVVSEEGDRISEVLFTKRKPAVATAVPKMPRAPMVLLVSSSTSSFFVLRAAALTLLVLLAGALILPVPEAAMVVVEM
mmetsp:Transcript_2598/g.7370  ORF Transcript_2598/g.7370 Transcript_2598/m.7370 type:complete len:213 (-) Transcript_2598:187-825(-)